ncbi:MAG: hypothetical protein IKJ11_03155 [Clostridia bacterium]|nr:hypothetical protein [Clostridia bacterium]
MREHIRVDLALLEQIEFQLKRLSSEASQLEKELNRLRYSMPDAAERLVQLEMAHERGRMLDATERADRLSRRVRQGIELFDRCETTILERVMNLETGANRGMYAAGKRDVWYDKWGQKFI